MGTISPKNGDRSLANRGYLQDGQPPLYYSNPDLWWAAKYHLSRLGQGGFREALEGIWTAVTGGERNGVELQKIVIGKPFRMTYEFAEERLSRHREDLFGGIKLEPLKRVYMVGDNPGACDTLPQITVLLIVLQSLIFAAQIPTTAHLGRTGSRSSSRQAYIRKDLSRAGSQGPSSATCTTQ